MRHVHHCAFHDQWAAEGTMSYRENLIADYAEYLSGNANKSPEYYARMHLSRGAKTALIKIYETGEWTTDPAILHHLRHHGLAVKARGYRLTDFGQRLARDLSEKMNGLRR
ncbi:hypothetical protein ACXM2N_03370 [Corynebacterium sp. ZY180755]